MTYRELNRSEKTWIASHVATDLLNIATDLLNMNDPHDEVSEQDMAKIIDARKRDAAMATLPPSGWLR